MAARQHNALIKTFCVPLRRSQSPLSGFSSLNDKEGWVLSRLAFAEFLPV